jgi:hypothetical protein
MFHFLKVAEGAILLALASGSLEAQSDPFQKGTWLLSGTGRLASVQPQAGSGRVFIGDINPSVGWFIGPHVAVLANAHLGGTFGGGNRSFRYGIGPGVSVYGDKDLISFLPFIPFVSVRSLIEWHKIRPDVAEADDDRQSFLLSVSLGGVLMLSSSVGISAELYFQDKKTSLRNGSFSSNSFGIQFAIDAFVL